MAHKVRVDETAFLLYTSVAEAAADLDIRWMVTGATSRVLLLENVYGLPRGKGTEDVDFAVMVENWEHYQSIVDRICRDPRFSPDNKQRQRIRGPHNMYLDLIPFGGIESDKHDIQWPPDQDFIMSVLGFREACDDAVEVIVNGKLRVPVVSPAGLMLLKLIAWGDRHLSHPRRDAADIAYVLRHCSSIETKQGLFEDHYDAVEQSGYDIDLAGVYVLGRRVGLLASADTHERLLALLDGELRMGTDSRLVYEIADFLPAAEENRCLQLLTQFRSGLLDGRNG